MLFQDTHDDRGDLTLFEDAIRKNGKLSSDTDEVKVLLNSSRHRIYFVFFATPYNRRSKVVENVSQ